MCGSRVREKERKKRKVKKKIYTQKIAADKFRHSQVLGPEKLECLVKKCPIGLERE